MTDRVSPLSTEAGPPSAASPLPSQIVSIVTYVIGGAGLAFGLTSHGAKLAIVSGVAVGATGLLAFVRHVITGRSDAVRLGFNTTNLNAQYEVGLANLAFGIAAIVAATTNWGAPAQLAVIVAFATYLLGSWFVHLRQVFTHELTPRQAMQFLIGTGAFVAVLFYAAAQGAAEAHLFPFAG